MERNKRALDAFKFHEADINAKCAVLGLPPLIAASYAHWRYGVEKLLDMGADRIVQADFGGHAGLGAMIGALDRIKNGAEVKQVLRQCALTLQTLAPIGLYLPVKALRVPREMYVLVGEEARSLGFLQVSKRLIELSNGVRSDIRRR
jgi:hypothetical protein